MFADQTTTLYVIGENGNATVLVTIRRDDSPPDAVAELQTILDSLQFLSPQASSPPSS